MRHRRLRLLLVLVAAVPALAACVVGLTSRTAAPGGCSPPTIPPGPDTLRTVPMRVLQSGQSTIAFVQVTIQGQGPFQFAVDTGASNTVVDTEVAHQLSLQVSGQERQVTGVVGQENVPVARVEQWQLGDVALPPDDVAIVDLPDAQHGGGGLQGLIGSDVLSRFAYVVVDYDDQRLGLPPA